MNTWRLLAWQVLACVVFGGAAAAGDPPAQEVRVEAVEFLDAALADCGIQRAIDAALARGGGTVCLPAGTYRLRRGLLLRDHVTVVGAGLDKTILTPARSAASGCGRGLRSCE
jgi:hypothetical protein